MYTLTVAVKNLVTGKVCRYETIPFGSENWAKYYAYKYLDCKDTEAVIITEKATNTVVFSRHK